jgi:hypothetical protein
MDLAISSRLFSLSIYHTNQAMFGFLFLHLVCSVCLSITPIKLCLGFFFFIFVLRREKVVSLLTRDQLDHQKYIAEVSLMARCLEPLNPIIDHAHGSPRGAHLEDYHDESSQSIGSDTLNPPPFGRMEIDSDGAHPSHTSCIEAFDITDP